MVESICDFIIKIFGNFQWIAVIIIAALPIVELRGAIPIANGMMNFWESYIFSVIGSTLPALIIVPLLIPFFNWLKTRKWARKFALHFEKKFKSKSKNIMCDAQKESEKKKKELVKFFGVFCFVAIPLPLTGAWTGSAISAYIGLDYKKSILAIFVGNMVAGAIMTAICVLWKGYESIILMGFLGLVILVFLVMLVIKLMKKTKLIEKVDAENIEKIEKIDGDYLQAFLDLDKDEFVINLENNRKRQLYQVGDTVKFISKISGEKLSVNKNIIKDENVKMLKAEILDIKTFEKYENFEKSPLMDTSRDTENFKQYFGENKNGVVSLKLRKVKD